ncbi:oxidoreductase [Promicromonospora thailandica]|uniref:Short-chain dehydrogenase n=1 Tax=Promicromonospora thailandica TaxID=765201 RepID=A0A9X2G7A0_9MICO|nr:oxidoreductase [Promicromonospora thailandica]MCP2267038.1 Short-chain dehydrogenase [Promicromonospora thailandica]BFF16683.1 oxidoreductase [Promicromonospora thailandica]
MTTTKHLTFLVTGVSSGLGRAIAGAALDAGHTVVGTVRTQADADTFEARSPGRAVARLLDVTDDDAVVRVVDGVEEVVGPIDVLVANAGYGHEGVFEESSMADLRRQFEVNVYGTVATVKAVLPHMRRRRRGHILGITSMAGLITVPGTSFYQGSKYAVEGILETVGKEVAPFGVHVTAVAPGSFRTDWAGRSMIRTERSIPDYDEVMTPVREHRLAADGRQLGNPQKAAEAVLTIVGTPDPPAHLVLGSDALRLVTNGRAAVDREIQAWAELSRSTDFPDGAQLAG